MNITNISIFAEGKYSGQTYEENRLIRTEIYEQLKDEIDEIGVYIGELDGKHSEVECDLEVESYTEKEIENTNWELIIDGENLYWELDEIFKNNNLNLKDELQIVKDYINNIDSYVDITVSIRKSNIDKVKKYCKEL